MLIRELTVNDAERCLAIVRGLPHFFGSEAGLVACSDALRTERGWVSEIDGAVCGFLTVDHPLPASAEITWMAVQAERRRGGLGRALVAHAAAALAADGALVLSVLTLAESVPETGDDTYDGTRKFYRRVGFLPIRELLPPRWEEMALLMVRPLSRSE